MIIIVLVLIGLASGIISGMGIGGGAILIPALVMFVKPGQHVAQGINLVYFIPTAIIALIVHIRNKMVDLKLAIPLILFGFVGAYIGVKTALMMQGDTLRKFFGFFLLAIGINEIFRKNTAK